MNDEEVHQVELLYLRLESEQPMHPSGATHISPGQSLSFNVTKRLTVNPNEMLMFDYDLTESDLEIYQGSFNSKVRYNEIDGFTTVSCDYEVIDGGEFTRKIIVNYTVNLISG
ncbi:hypothetical protein [Peribacillus butanolivorans]|uniref:hypothetical protein n=1 Tax=Peribacillus butanolivorans TaxID=421767 RepID=UPI00381AD802